MYWQDLRLVDARSLTGTSGEETIDLPAKGYLSALDIRIDAKESESGRNCIKGQIDLLKKIEVVHMGTQVIKSYNGRVARGIAFLDDGKIPFSKRGWAAVSTNGYAYCPVHFGRRARDLEYALDLSKLTDPKLKIEWDATITDPYTTYGFHSTPVVTLSVLTQTIREPALTPRGYIKTSQVKEYTIAEGTIEEVKMPLGNPFRRILIRPYEEHTTVAVWGQSILEYLLEKIVLDINDGERRPVQLKPNDYSQAYLRDYGMAKYSERQRFRNGDMLDSHMGLLMGGSIEAFIPDELVCWTSGETPCTGTYVRDNAGGAVTSDEYHGWTAWGPNFESLVPIAFDLNGFEHLLETRDLSKVKLELTGYSSLWGTEKCYVYLEELVTQ